MRTLALVALLSAVRGLVFQPPCRTVALGDVHGDYEAMVRSLKLADLIDEDQQWVGGEATLVQLGDMLDRGDSEREHGPHGDRRKRFREPPLERQCKLLKRSIES